MLVLQTGDDEFKQRHAIEELRQRFQIAVADIKTIEDPSIPDLIRFIQVGSNLFNFKQTDSRYLYIVKNFSLLKGKSNESIEIKSSNKQEEQIQRICLETIQSCIEKNILIFSSENIRQNLKFVKELKKFQNCNLIECNEFKSWDTLPCKNYLKTAIAKYPEIQISENDLEKFINYRGPENLAAIFQELETLSKSFTRIDFNLLQKYFLPKYDIFHFADSIALNKKQEAIKELRKMQDDPEQKNNLGLLSILQNQITLYYNTKTLSQHKFNNDQIANQLGIKPQRVYHLRLNSENVSLRYLKSLAKKLLSYERRIKKGEMKLQEALSLLIHTEEDQSAAT